MNLKKIGSLVKPVQKWDPRKCETNKLIDYIDIASVDRVSKTITAPTKVLAHQAPSRAKQLINYDDVIVSTVRPNLNGVAHNINFDGATASTGYSVLRPNSDLDAKYLYYWVRSTSFVNDMCRNTSGANYPAVSDKIVKNSFIPLPSTLDEQKRIAAILDKADALRRKQKKALDLCDDFLKATFIDMFGDPVTNPKGWEVKQVKDWMKKGYILEVQDGNHGNRHPKVVDFTIEGLPFIAANVIKDGKIDYEKCYYLDESWLTRLRIGFAKPYDVLLSHKGTVGLSAILDETYDTYIFSPQTTYYRLNNSKIKEHYLKAYFESNYFQQLLHKVGKQSTRVYVGITKQKDLPLMLPSFALQTKFAEIATKIEEQKIKLQQSLDKLNESFNALSQRAFKGEL
ncbi:restriction endonuclease subunit S [Lentisphaera marina]|uniref:restriction endonuclease subunit S n=1 Tax=Lentisphaera marina TaxID=1111041 RepID=UPI0023662F1F|nr:restriction endonuclease subunit S [Lentisphaera marina]MDD7984698.1 restriction endonuclease subunit S [Lentisphaera marina]